MIDADAEVKGYTKEVMKFWATEHYRNTLLKVKAIIISKPKTKPAILPLA